MTRRHLVPVLLGTLLVATACSSSGSRGGHGTTGAGTLPTLGATAAGGGQATGPTGTTSAAAKPVSAVTLRYVDLFTHGGLPGGAIDVYDTPQGQAATPLIKNLAYATVSAYVHPHEVGGNVSQFYALPTGEDPVKQAADAQGLGGLQDTGSHPQLTYLLSGEPNSLGTGPLSGLSISTFVEKGDDGNGSKGPVAPAAASGQAEILADAGQVATTDSVTFEYLFIDSSCAPPLNSGGIATTTPEIAAADGADPKSSFAVFATSPGAHQVSLAGWHTSTPPTCAQLTPHQAQTSLTLQAGEQVLAFVYGSGAADLHVVLAPIQQ